LSKSEIIKRNGHPHIVRQAAEPSLLAGLLVDARGERLTPSHAVKKGRRYRYYVSAALITDAGTDREGWRLAAREIEEAVIRILADALTSPASLVERFGATGMSGHPHAIASRKNVITVEIRARRAVADSGCLVLDLTSFAIAETNPSADLGSDQKNFSPEGSWSPGKS
jgi:hypothetical protein